MRRLLKGVGLILAGLVLFALLTVAPNRTDLDLAGRVSVSITVLDHGWHSGLVVSVPDLTAAAERIEDPDLAARLVWLASRFPEADWIEIGWGDAEFYRATPQLADIDPWLGVRALLWPTGSVLHLVPGRGRSEAFFATSDRLTVQISAAAFDRLAVGLAETVPADLPRGPVGPGLYGGGVFYAASLDYHLFRTCNQWVSGLLRRAGLPSSPIPGTFSAGLIGELRLRLPD